ncbi:hypothetical protein ACFY0A_33830 [Streptomyces sp. NPDC001698]|uniref:hypothetical protein n=1 Tax=unclassified Streptomyces TaxID=2593676 RepID=UPI0036AB7776
MIDGIRVREVDDRRVVHLRYEERAQELVRDFFTPIAEATEATRRRFTDEELGTFVDFLATLDDGLRKLRPAT